MKKVKKTTIRATTERASLVLQGSVAILFGIAAVFWPGLTAVTLAVLFAFFLLLDGIIISAWGVVKLQSPSKAMLALFLGIIELGLGMYLLRNTKVAFASLILILGFSLIIRGIFSFSHSFTSRERPNLKIMHAILGALGVVIGIFILLQPVAGGLAFVWILGFYALVAGPVMIAMSSELGKQ